MKVFDILYQHKPASADLLLRFAALATLATLVRAFTQPARQLEVVHVQQLSIISLHWVVQEHAGLEL